MAGGAIWKRVMFATFLLDSAIMLWYRNMHYSLLATNWMQIDGASHADGLDETIVETILAFRKVSDFTPYLDYLGHD